MLRPPIIAAVLAGAGLLAFLGIWIVAGALAAALDCSGRDARWGSVRPHTSGASGGGSFATRRRSHSPRSAFILYYRIAIVVLSLVSDETQTGYFSVSYRVIEALATLPSLLVASAFPVIARAARGRRRTAQVPPQRLFEIAVIGGAWLAMVTVIGAALAVPLLGGEDFEPSTPVLEIQGFSLAATFLLFTWGFTLLALRRNRALITVIIWPDLRSRSVAHRDFRRSLRRWKEPRPDGPHGVSRSPRPSTVWRSMLDDAFDLRSASFRECRFGRPQRAGAVAFVSLPTLLELVVATGSLRAVLRALGGFPHEIRGALALGRVGEPTQSAPEHGEPGSEDAVTGKPSCRSSSNARATPGHT